MTLSNIKTIKRSQTYESVRHILLYCGIIASLLYAAMNVFIPMLWKEYSSISQTVSELSAIGAPTRTIWVILSIPYTLLMFAFGWGVWMSADRSQLLRIAAGLIIAFGIMGLFWPPMHQRGDIYSATDTMHIVFSLVALLLMVLSIGFGAEALGKGFRIYSYLTILVFAAFGLLTAKLAPGIAANLPTPYIGIWERINIAAFLIWIVVLAIDLLHIRFTAHRLIVANKA